jgi:hypothetical protein
MSARASRVASATCSGDMYATLPLMLPSFVERRRPRALAMPKSISFVTPFGPTMRFCGETSRWTMPSRRPSSPIASCAAWRPRSASTAIAIATSTGRRVSSGTRPSRRLASDTPGRYSMTRRTSSCVSTTSSTSTTLGWRTRIAVRASSSNISTSSSSRRRCGWSRLMATVSEPAPTRRRPKYTLPIPPDANSAWSV